MIDSNQILDVYELSDKEIAASLGERFRNYRNAIGLSQKDVAFQSGVSVMTIVRFERGQGFSIRLDNLIALIRAIQRLDEIAGLIPELPQSLYQRRKRT